MAAAIGAGGDHRDDLAAHLKKGFEYAKQRCTAYPRYVVQRTLFDRFLTMYLQVARSLTFGHPLAVVDPEDEPPNLDFGPLINAAKVTELGGDVYLWFLGWRELVGHLPIYGIMALLVIWGEERKQTEDALRQSLEDVTRMQQLSTRLLQADDFSLLLHDILDAAIAISEPAAGSEAPPVRCSASNDSTSMSR